MKHRANQENFRDSIMTTLTIRTSKQESETIEKLKSFFGIGHGSKALLRAAEELPRLYGKYNVLEADYLALQAKHFALLDALNDKKNIQSKIDEFLNLN